MAKNYIDRLVRDGTPYFFLDRSAEHKNLLLNPFFTVNQRGQSSYTSHTSVEIYTVDRWKIRGGTAENIQTGGINVKFTAGEYHRFLQKLDFIPKIGEVYTLSIHCNIAYNTKCRLTLFDGTSALGNAGYGIELPESGEVILTRTITIGENPFTRGYAQFGIYGNPNGAMCDIDIYSMKLERGYVSTLAYDRPPNYLEELVRCYCSHADPADEYANRQLIPTIKRTLDEVAVPDTEYYLGTQTSVSLVLPSGAMLGQRISVVWYNGATPATLSITGTVLDVSYTPSANSRSEVNALWDGTYWAIVTNEQAVPAEETV